MLTTTIILVLFALCQKLGGAHEEIGVKMEIGDGSTDGGSGEETTFDICPDCFSDKLISALKAMGARPSVREWYC